MPRKQIESSVVLREVGRIVTGAYYDHQKIRQTEKNRIRSIVRSCNEKIDLTKPEKKKKKTEKFKAIYLDVNLPKLLEMMLKKKKITQQEYDYIQQVLEVSNEAEKYELHYKKLMEGFVFSEPIYTEFLQHVRGISSVISANLLKEYGYCENYEYVSSLWKHSGMHVVDGKAPKLKRGEKIDWNPKLRTLAWLIADSFVKQRTPVYRDIYDAEKERQLALVENKAENAPKNKLHADLRARRKMVKIFLQHYWIKARELKGLPISKPYPIDKLGHKHYITVDDVIKAQTGKK